MNDEQDIWGNDPNDPEYDIESIYEHEMQEIEAEGDRDQWLKDALADGTIKPCQWCREPITLKGGRCLACEVPSTHRHVRHLPDHTDHQYKTVHNRYGFKDYDFREYFMDYALAMLAHHENFGAQEHAVLTYLYGQCNNAGRVVASLSAVSKTTGVSRNNLKPRAGRPNHRDVMANLVACGALEEFDDKHATAKGKSLYLPLTWSRRIDIGMKASDREKAFRRAMMSPDQKHHHDSKARRDKGMAKIRGAK